jgi:hypothetical protein
VLYPPIGGKDSHDGYYHPRNSANLPHTSIQNYPHRISQNRPKVNRQGIGCGKPPHLKLFVKNFTAEYNINIMEKGSPPPIETKEISVELKEYKRKTERFFEFLILKMNPAACWSLYRKDKKQVSLKDFNDVFNHKMDSREVCFFFPEEAETANKTIYASSNGFTLQLARGGTYALLDPSSGIVKRDLNYDDGVKLLQEEAKKYQAEMFENFDNGIKLEK